MTWLSGQQGGRPPDLASILVLANHLPLTTQRHCQRRRARYFSPLFGSSARRRQKYPPIVKTDNTCATDSKAAIKLLLSKPQHS